MEDRKFLRVVQLQHPALGRRVALVAEPKLEVIEGSSSLYQLGIDALNQHCSLSSVIDQMLVELELDYDSIYLGTSEWKLLPSFDHPQDTARCLVTGTGLTHESSARNRHSMHSVSSAASTPPTDSSTMFQWGKEGGKPEAGAIGIRPEWFYKGTGANLRAHGDAIEVQPFCLGCGEEPEIAGLYVIGADYQPYRIGFTAGNEFSEHELEKKNYLYLAQSKLQPTAIGPEALIGDLPEAIDGDVSIYRGDVEVWKANIATGERNMTHSIVNLEHHHFKHPQNRRPLDAHIHFFGADAFSHGASIAICDQDEMRIEWSNMGRPLRNRLERLRAEAETLVTVNVL